MYSKLRRMINVITMLALVSSSGLTVFAQNATGSIRGTVKDANEALVENASVTATNKATGAVRKIGTGGDGVFVVENLIPGEYEVKIEAQGFAPQTTTLTVEVGGTTSALFNLTVGGQAEAVEIAAGGTIINKTDAVIGGVVTRNQVESLPLNGRSFLSVAMLEPGVTVTYQATSGVLNQNDFFQVGVAGAPSYMTTISVDGARANDRITGGTSQNFSAETVQEFQISTIGFDLSAGTVSAGAVNIVSRGGSNEFHGSGFFFFRDHNMAAFSGLSRPTELLPNGLPQNPLCLNPNSDGCQDALDPFFVRKQYGGTFGGPIKKNKLFFFTNYEKNDQVGAQPITFGNPILAGFNHVGKVPFEQDLFGTRVDYKINDDHSLFFRGNIDSNDSVAGGGLESTWIGSSNFSYQTQFALTSVLKANLVNDLRFSYSYYRNRLFPPSEATCINLASNPDFCLGVGSTQINFFSGLSIGNNANTPQDRHPRTYQITENVSWTKGSHRLRFGGNWEHVYSHGSWNRNFAGTFSTFNPETVRAANPAIFATLPATLKPELNAGTPSFADLLQLPVSGQLTIGIGDPHQPVEYLYDKLTTNDHIRFYAQDGWQIRPSFTLNYGLAWSYENNNPYHFLDRPEYLRPTGLRLDPIPQDKNNFDPAVGFAWSVTDNTVIRGSGSLHHSSGNRNYLKLQDQILIGPAGSGLVSAGSASVTNPFCMPQPDGRCALVLGSRQPALLNFSTTAPTTFRAQNMLEILAFIRQTLVNNNPYTGLDLGIRNIEVRKQAPAAGTEAIFDADHRTPYTIHFNIGVQREIMRNLSVQADFVMRRAVKFGQNEFMLIDVNRWNRFSNYDILPNGVANPLPYRNPQIPQCLNAAQANDPTADCSLGPIFYAEPGIISRYSALQVKVDKRFANGFQLTGAYALSRYTTFNGYNSYLDHSENFGLSGATPKHNFTFSGIWDLPKYKGDNVFMRGALNGWQLSSIMQFRSRDINSVTFGTFDPEGDGSFYFRLPGSGINEFGRGLNADDIRRLVADYNSKFPSGPNVPLRDIPRQNRDAVGAAFPYIVLPEEFSSGDSFITTDLRVTRTIAVGEKVRLNLIAEGFNIFNIANLAGYSGSLGSAAWIRPTATAPGMPNPNNNFGRATSRVSPIFGTGGPRAFQVAARVNF